MAATKTKPKSAAKKSKAAAKPAGASASKRAKKGAAAVKKTAAPVSRTSGPGKAKPAAAKAKSSKAAKAPKASPAPKPKAAAKARSTKPPTAQAAKSAKAGTPKTRKDAPDFSEFPAGHVTRHEVTLCLACVFHLYTEQLGLAPRTAYNEIRGYAPTVAELTAREPQRPFFKPPAEKSPRCPYCEAPGRWHAPLRVYRVEGGRATDAARRALVKKLPVKDGRFQVHEERSAARQVFFEWLERLGQGLDFGSDEAWLPAAAREYLRRREPKTDWDAAFEGVRHVRRSRRLEEGWEREGARLFLAPALYDDVLLVQYLVSRSQRHGGSTSDGRLTLREMVGRLRRGAAPPAPGAAPADEFEFFERQVDRLTGGDAPARLHFVVDRRELLDRAKEVYDRQTA